MNPCLYTYMYLKSSSIIDHDSSVIMYALSPFNRDTITKHFIAYFMVIHIRYRTEIS